MLQNINEIREKLEAQIQSNWLEDNDDIRLIEWVEDNIPMNRDGFMMLLDVLQDYDIAAIYRFLFYDFPCGIMTHDEKVELAKRFVGNFELFEGETIESLIEE